MSRASGIVLVVLLAGLAHAFYFARNDELLTDDSHTYLATARSLTAGHGFLNAAGVPETRRTPGYPLFLAVVAGNNPLRAVIVQHILALGLVAGLFVIVARISGSPLAGLAAAGILAIDLPTLHHANSILTESLFTHVVFLMALLLYLAARRASVGLALLAGVTGGLAVLVRPIAMYSFVIGAAFLLLFGAGRRWIAAVAFLCGFALAPLGWSARNEAVAGQFTISTISAWSLLCDRAAATLAIDDPGRFSTNLHLRRAELLARLGEPPAFGDPNVLMQVARRQPDERYRSLAIEVLRSRPGAYLRVWLRSLSRTLLAGGSNQIQKMFGITGRGPLVAIGALNVLILLAGIVGVFRLARTWPDVAVLCVLLIGYYLVTASVGEPSARFRVPIQPYLAILAGAAVAPAGRMRGDDAQQEELREPSGRT